MCGDSTTRILGVDLWGLDRLHGVKWNPTPALFLQQGLRTKHIMSTATKDPILTLKVSVFLSQSACCMVKQQLQFLPKNLFSTGTVFVTFWNQQSKSVQRWESRKGLSFSPRLSLFILIWMAPTAGFSLHLKLWPSEQLQKPLFSNVVGRHLVKTCSTWAYPYVRVPIVDCWSIYGHVGETTK